MVATATYRMVDGLSSATSKAGQLQRDVFELLHGPRHAGSGALPTSLRFLFYELLQMGVLEKKARDGKGRRPDQDLSDAAMHLRRLGQVPWEWIVDETRTFDVWRYSESVYQYAIAGAASARIDCWDGEPAPLILTESRSLAGVLRDIAARYLCPIAATNGQVGGFLHTEIMPRLEPEQRVLYLGDYDHAGGQIEANTRREIEREVGPLRWERLALTAEQVAEHDIPAIEKRDRRYRDGMPHRAYETRCRCRRSQSPHWPSIASGRKPPSRRCTSSPRPPAPRWTVAT